MCAFRVLLLALALIWAGKAAAQSPSELKKLDAEIKRLGKLGKQTEAIALAKRTVALREKALGPVHADVAKSLETLARLYREDMRLDEGEAPARRALAIRTTLLERSISEKEKALGAESPEVSLLLDDLAELYLQQSREADAELLYKRSFGNNEKALGAKHRNTAVPLYHLADMYVGQGRYVEAEALYKRALEIGEAAGGPWHTDVGWYLNNLADLYRLEGRTSEAEPLFKRAISILENALGPEHPHVAKALRKLGLMYWSSSRRREAGPLFQRAFDINWNVRGPLDIATAESMVSLANNHREFSRDKDAELLYDMAIVSYSRALGPDHPTVGTVLERLASLYSAQGRFNLAEPQYQRALKLFERAYGSESLDCAEVLKSLALLYTAQNRFEESHKVFQRAAPLLEKLLGPEHPLVAEAIAAQGFASLGQNKLVEAADRWRRATNVFQRHGDLEVRRHRTYYELLVRTVHRISLSDRTKASALAAEMFLAAQWPLGSKAATSLTQMAVRSAQGSQTLAALVRERQDLIAERQNHDALLIAALGEPPVRRSAAREKALTDRITAIDTRVLEIDGQLAIEFPSYAELANPKPIAVNDVQSNLREDEALVLFFDTKDNAPEETFIWVVARSELRWLSSNVGTTALKREVAALRCGLDATNWVDASQWEARDDGETRRKREQMARRTQCKELTGAEVSDDDPPPFSLERSYALYDSLLGGASDLLRGKRLLIVPAGALTALPFQVLIDKAPSSQDPALASWLVREHAITVLPSVSSLAALRRTEKSRSARKPVIGFANPLLEGDPGSAASQRSADRARAQTGCADAREKRTAHLRSVIRGANPAPQTGQLADVSLLRRQAPLPETADEVCDVIRSLGADVSDVYLGARATEAEVKRLSENGELSKYQVVHFATHGLLAGELSDASEPGLILTPPSQATIDDDGFLSASEIAGLKLEADWVILSACNTAGEAAGGNSSEALAGLARAFFYAGARSLLVSHWAVDSDAAVKIVIGAAGALAKDKSIDRAEALRRAMLSLMADTSRPSTWTPAAHPSIWAPFVMVGDSGLGR